MSIRIAPTARPWGRKRRRPVPPPWPTVYVASADYIPSSTADLWRCTRRHRGF